MQDQESSVGAMGPVASSGPPSPAHTYAGGWSLRDGSTRFQPSGPSPAGRWWLAEAPDLPDEEPGLAFEEARFAAEEKALAELGRFASAGTWQKRPANAPEMIERLGDLMALLGPRYKTVKKEMLWHRAEVGDLGAFHRKLLREKQEREQGARTEEPRRRAHDARDASDAELDPDPDGRARAAWLSARAQEAERRARTTSPSGSPVATAEALSSTFFQLTTKA